MAEDVVKLREMARWFLDAGPAVLTAELCTETHDALMRLAVLEERLTRTSAWLARQQRIYEPGPYADGYKAALKRVQETLENLVLWRAPVA